MPTLSEIVGSLGRIIATTGSMHVEDAKRWLLENGAKDSKQAGLALGQGMGKSRQLWHRQGDLLVAGPALNARPPVVAVTQPSAGNGHAATELPAPTQPPLASPPAPAPLVSEQPLSDVRTEIIAAATGIGIQTSWATAIATFLVRSYDVYEPEEVWAGLNQVTEVPISQRRRFFRTWMSYVGSQVPQALEEKIRVQAPLYEDQRASASGQSRRQGRKFYAVDGEVLPCPPDAEEEMGVSWPAALQMARQQVAARSVPPVPVVKEGEGSVVAALVTQMGENSRHTLEMMAGNSGEDPEKKALAVQLENTRLESLRSELRAEMRAEALETKHQMEMMQSGLTGSLTDLTKAVTAIAGSMAKPPASPFDALKDLAKLKDDLAVLFPPPAPQQAYNLPIGPNGQVLPLNLEDMFKFMEFQDRRATVQTLRDGVPNIIQLGRDVVEALHRGDGVVERPEAKDPATAQPPAESPAIPMGPRTTPAEPSAPPADEERLVQNACIGCGVKLSYPPTVEYIECPRCETTMLVADGKLAPPPDGTVLGPRQEEEEAEPESAAAPAAVQETPSAGLTPMTPMASPVPEPAAEVSIT